MSTETMRISRFEILRALRNDMDRAYKDAEERLTEPYYDITDGMLTQVDVQASTGGGTGRVGKYKRVGHAINRWEWEVVEP